MAQTFTMVLCDELQEVYLDFKEKRNFDQDIITKLLKYFKGPFATNTAQYNRIGREPSPTVNQRLRSAGFTTQSLEDLAEKTVFKIILSSDNNQFPYVNINGDTIENNLTGCFERGNSREKAIKHIQALCKNAKEVCLYDKYITTRGNERAIQQNLELFASLLPKKALCIVYQAEHLQKRDEDFLNGICNRWTFEKKTNIPEHHDRYLIIDNKIEIILTSGFSSLSDRTKEFTYIVRPVIKNRFE